MIVYKRDDDSKRLTEWINENKLTQLTYLVGCLLAWQKLMNLTRRQR